MAGERVDIAADGVVAHRAGDGITHVVGYGAPTSAAVGYAKGCQWTDMTNGALYLNSGTQTSATWIADTIGSTASLDTISEFTAGSGVTIDGVLLKDDGVEIGASGYIRMNAGAIALDADDDTWIEAELDDRITIAVAGAVDFHFIANTFEVDDGSLIHYMGSGTGTGDVVQRVGLSSTEGLEMRVYEATVTPAAVETNLINVPAKSRILSVQANVQAALTGGGTTVAWGIGTAADGDKYGFVEDLTQNQKLDYIGDGSVLSSAEQMVLTGLATGGGSDGDTALTVGSVRVRVVYLTVNSLDDAA